MNVTSSFFGKPPEKVCCLARPPTTLMHEDKISGLHAVGIKMCYISSSYTHADRMYESAVLSSIFASDLLGLSHSYWHTVLQVRLQTRLHN